MIVWQEYRQIWNVTRLRSPRLVMWLVGMLAVSVLAIGMVAHARPEVAPGVALRIVCGVAAAWLTAAWGNLLATSFVLDAGAHARLVPRQRRRFLEMASGGPLLILAGTAIAAGTWKAMVPAAVLLLMSVPDGSMWRLWIWGAFFALSKWDWLWQRVLPDATFKAGWNDPPLMAALLLVELLALAWTLRALYPASGRPRRYGTWADGTPRQPIRFVNARSPNAYLARLRRDCRRLDPGALLAHALGPSLRWSRWMPVFVGAPLLLCAIKRAWWPAHDPSDALGVPAVMWLVTMLLRMMFEPAIYRSLLQIRRGEQALLRLAPVTGDTVLLNRRLAPQLLRQLLATQAVMATAILLGSALLGVGPDNLVRELALCCLAAQVGLYRLLDDYAAARQDERLLPAIVLVAFEAAAGVMAGVLLHVSPWLTVCALAVLVAVWQVRRDWRRMLAARPAYPAGRLG